MKGLHLLIFLLMTSFSYSQNTDSSLPYYEIPEAPEKFNACTVAARTIDGLGFRYYWATEGLRAEDLQFKPNEEARNVEATIDHILGLTTVVLNAVKNQPNSRSDENLSFEEKRKRTLLNIQEASNLLKEMKPKQMKKLKVIFQRGENRSEYPFWNILNGPLADAIWHVGQVVSFRRSSGNPLNSRASMFSGKLRKK